MRVNRLYEPVTIGVLLFLLLKLLIAAATLAGVYYKLPPAHVSGLGDTKAELIALKSESERTYKIKDVTTKRVETIEYTLSFEPSFEWNNAIDHRHRAQLNKFIQEGIEATATDHLKRKITLQNPVKQTSQIELDPGQGSTWELQVKQEVVVGRVIIAQGKGEPIIMPFRLVITKSFEGHPVKSRWWW